jgi:hypothetical protein
MNTHPLEEEEPQYVTDQQAFEARRCRKRTWIAIPVQSDTRVTDATFRRPRWEIVRRPSHHYLSVGAIDERWVEVRVELVLEIYCCVVVVEFLAEDLVPLETEILFEELCHVIFIGAFD